MDSIRFDHWTRTASAAFSRRGFAAALGLAALALPGLAGAKKKRKKKKKKVTFNDFGCVDVGKFCKTSEQCCSGICQGKKGKKRCQAHDASTCQVDQNSCEGILAECTTSTGQQGFCRRTTGNAAYCADTQTCVPCQKDADCVAVCGPQAACVPCGFICGGDNTLCVGIGPDPCTA